MALRLARRRALPGEMEEAVQRMAVDQSLPRGRSSCGAG